MADWQRKDRLSGIVELVCPHGVGHPSRKLTTLKRPWREGEGIHGCDGCCGGPEFAQAEADTERARWMRMGREKKEP